MAFTGFKGQGLFTTSRLAKTEGSLSKLQFEFAICSEASCCISGKFYPLTDEVAMDGLTRDNEIAATTKQVCL